MKQHRSDTMKLFKLKQTSLAGIEQSLTRHIINELRLHDLDIKHDTLGQALFEYLASTELQN
ncbi:CLUMA_CG004603, isoform A [Clunio marinus]|uniref:CLUMA_CG004603, isoform A n=1 Tax=Clunio marinus TaxID=568069 RepID=A0A1J1HTM9_9DIPT|nr:CLUMA_CG004603, isoform A [Clunio marinus]